MQNNVTELTQRLLRSLDSNYNVIDMPAVIEIISLLEKVAITKELLETTRLGKHVNELRRKTSNDSLSKRAKELVKKWRSMVLPEPNGQIKSAGALPCEQDDVNLNQLRNKKRSTKEILDNLTLKRAKMNGMSELDFSDNSNSSFKDVINSNLSKAEPKRDVILINSDSNSSMPEAKQDPLLDQQMPKKRGRKKGSKNHKNLIDEAESSFTSKLAVSRGNSKVKTTQELLASLQNKNTNSVLGLPANAKSKEDLNERAAKLTERVSIIDQKLNTNANRFKNSQRKNKNTLSERNERVIESGSVINDKSLINSSADEDIIVVDDGEAAVKSDIEDKEKQETDDDNVGGDAATGGGVSTIGNPTNVVSSLSIEDALSQLPPVDKSVLLESDDDEETATRCTCFLKENKRDFSVEEDDDDVDAQHRFEFVEDHECPSRIYLENKYHLNVVSEARVQQLHTASLPNVNGNCSIGPPKPSPELLENGLYVNVVPNVNNEYVKRDIKNDFSCENFKKYSISERGVTAGDDNSDVMYSSTDRTGADDGPLPTSTTTASDNSFREWHEVIEIPSYNGEILKILPYVIID